MLTVLLHVVATLVAAAALAFDLHSVCNVHLGDLTDYGYVVGLALNISRAESRAALAHAIGSAVAMGNKHVPASLFEGVTASAKEAQELAFKINVERDKAIFEAKSKQGPMGLLGGRR